MVDLHIRGIRDLLSPLKRHERQLATTMENGGLTLNAS
jgi:hypothetical protein